MVASEALLKLRSQTAETRNKTSGRIQPFAQKRHTDTHPYLFKTNQVIVKSKLSQGAETLHYKIPAYGSVCGEIWVEFDLPALDQAADRYDPSCVLNMISEVRLKHSDVFYSYKPNRIFPILCSRDRDNEGKAAKIAIFGPRTEQNGAIKVLLPILTPFSQWFDAEFYKAGGNQHAKRNGLFRADLLRSELCVEMDVNPLSSYSKAGSAFSGTDAPTNVTVKWEELISPNMPAIKKLLPTSCVGNIYTHQDGIRNEGVATVYKISGVAARAPNEAIIIFQKADSDSSRDPFKYLATVSTEKLTLDGREVINTDELGSDQARAYEDLRKGVIPSSRGDPCLPKVTFSASSGDDVKFVSGVLSNTAANQFELEIKSAEACDLCITMEQCQTYRFENGTIKHSNAY